MRYFVAGNGWLFLGFLLVVGKTFERSQPLRYSFFGAGHWFTPLGYHLLLTLVLLLALTYFWIYFKTQRP